MKTEIAELQNSGKIYEISEKITHNIKLDTVEQEVVTLCDAWVREVGEKGDSNKEIAAFIKRTINEELYNAPDELLDSIFDRGSVGEFDDYEAQTTPENTLVAHEAAKGGTVDRSWIDFSVLKPTWKNRQVETDLSYVDMRKNGFKSVATLTTYATEALQNAMFYDMFSAMDLAIPSGEQVIEVTGATPTKEAMDKLALYLLDRDSNAFAIALNKYSQAIANISGYTQYMSESMKDNFNRYGLVDFYQGIRIAGISAAKKVAGKQLMIPDKRIFGVAGKIGTLDMKGEVHVYEDMDNSTEKLVIRVKDFTYGYAITNIENVAKITFSA